MVILQDTREQSPLFFSHKFITNIEKMTLPVGDYGVRYEQGYVLPVVFERKSIGDLFGSLGKGYKRFKNELLLAKELDLRLILIIEGAFSEVLKGYEQSTLSGLSIIKKIFTLWVRYNLIPVFCKDREECASFITEYYLAIGRNLDFKKMGYSE